MTAACRRPYGESIMVLGGGIPNFCPPTLRLGPLSVKGVAIATRGRQKSWGDPFLARRSSTCSCCSG